MKEIVGYLIDRETGVGISGKTVSFEDLSGSPISDTVTKYQDVSSATDANGRFYAKFELSPGPVNVQVDVSGSEVKVRKHDEKAQIGYQWGSDISRISRVLGNGIIRGFLDEMEVVVVSGHTYRVKKGGAIIDGALFSIEDMGGAAGVDIVGSANPSGPANPRLDLITLRQYKESASGQNSGKQQIVVTEGTTSNVVPDTPTGADFTDLPIGVVSTAQGAATKTIHSDPRDMVGPGDQVPVVGSMASTGHVSLGQSFSTVLSPTVSGLDSKRIYDGYLSFQAGLTTLPAAGSTPRKTYIQILHDNLLGGGVNDISTSYNSYTEESDFSSETNIQLPIIGLTGVTSLTLDIKMRGDVITFLSNPSINYSRGYIYLTPRV